MFGDAASGAYLVKFSWTDIVRHIPVTTGSSPDDPALAEYWAARRRRIKPPLHLVRAKLRYASKAHWSAITKQLRTVYTAPTVDAAEARFADFETDWGERYAAIIRLWRGAWEEFTPFLAFPPEVRRVIYTTNAVESLNSRFWQATRRRGISRTTRPR